MIVPPPLDYGKNNICSEDCEQCDKNKDCEFKELKQYIDILNKNAEIYLE